MARMAAAAEGRLAAIDRARGLASEKQLRAGLEGGLEYVESNPAAYVALVRGAAGADQALGAVCERTRQAIVERVVAGLGMPVDQGLALLRLGVRGWVGPVEEATISWVQEPTVARQKWWTCWTARSSPS